MLDVVKGKVAFFLDLENIRYSSLRQYGLEPSVSQIIDTVRKYGTISVAEAYADLDRHPQWLLREFQVAGVASRHVALRKQQTDDGGEYFKSSADMYIQQGMMETAIDRSDVDTFVLMSGDQDFIPVVAWLRNRFQKKVVIFGVEGSMSSDLVKAAGEVVYLEPEHIFINDEIRPIIPALIRVLLSHRPPKGFWTAKYLFERLQRGSYRVPGTVPQINRALSFLIQEGIVTRALEKIEERDVQVLKLQDHPMVREVQSQL